MTDEQQLYDDHILRHFQEPYHAAAFVQLELQVSDAGIIEQAWFTGTGCVISQSSASMLVEYIEGRTLEELSSFGAEDMLQLFRARLTPLRQQCCLLAWKALQQLLIATRSDQ